MRQKFQRILAIFILCSITTLVFSEEAPVYDVDGDAYPPSFDQPDPNYSSLSALQQRLQRLEQQIKALQNISSSAKMDALQAEIQSLRGQVEQLTHEIEQIKSTQKNLYVDWEDRFKQLSKTNNLAVEKDSVRQTPRDTIPAAKLAVSSPVVVKKATVSLVPQPAPAEEQSVYQAAYDLIKAKKYSEAINTLQSMLKKYPSGQFAANAHYWLGELYGLLNKNNQSANEFAVVIKHYSDSPKAADAQLKLGLIYLAQFKWAEAKAAFKKVILHSPGTASARLATEQLKQIKKTGH